MIHDESTSKIPAVSRDTRQDASLSARLGLPSPPIFLRFAFHCRRIRILALDPVPGAAGRIRGVATLRHDPLQAQLAGMLLVEPQPWLSTLEGALKQRLSLDQRFAPHVGPVELDQIEGPHEHALVAVPSPDQ